MRSTTNRETNTHARAPNTHYASTRNGTQMMTSGICKRSYVYMHTGRKEDSPPHTCRHHHRRGPCSARVPLHAFFMQSSCVRVFMFVCFPFYAPYRHHILIQHVDSHMRCCLQHLHNFRVEPLQRLQVLTHACCHIGHPLPSFLPSFLLSLSLSRKWLRP